MGLLVRNFIKLFRLFGIDVGITPNWLLMFLVGVAGLTAEVAAATGLAGPAAAAVAGAIVLIVYASIVAHEFGHSLTARAFGVNTSRIVLHLFGGVAMLDSEPRRPRDEFWITAAGPAVSFLLAAMLGAGWLIALEMGAGPVALTILGWTAAMNAFLGLFNCIPGYPMDGGRIVHSAIWAATGNYVTATRVAHWGGIAFGGVLAGWGLHTLLGGTADAVLSGIVRILFGYFLITLARAQWRQARMIAPFLNLTVRDFVRPVRAVVPSDAMVSEVVDDFFRPMRMDLFPVADGDRLLGCIDARDVEAREKRQWPWLRASELMRPYDDAKVVSPDVDAVVALGRFGRAGRGTLAVFEGRRLLGHIVERDFFNHMKARQQAV